MFNVFLLQIYNKITQQQLKQQRQLAQSRVTRDRNSVRSELGYILYLISEADEVRKASSLPSSDQTSSLVAHLVTLNYVH